MLLQRGAVRRFEGSAGSLLSEAKDLILLVIGQGVPSDELRTEGLIQL